MLTSLFLFSCQKQENIISNLNGGKIIILGHGGLGRYTPYPSNSYESILKCLEAGADGSEFDVQMTKDSILVAFHSADLSDETDGEGMINDYNWEEIKNSTYNSGIYRSHQMIVPLTRLFEKLPNLHHYQFSFDCKLYSHNPDLNEFYAIYARTLHKMIQKYELENNIYIESQTKDFLALMQQKNVNYPLLIYPFSFEDGLNIAKEMNLFGISISTRDISASQIAEAHKENVRVAIWSVYTHKQNKEAIAKNPDIIQTDKVKDLIDLLQ